MLARVAHNLGELYSSLGDRGRARALSQYARRVGGEGLPSQVAARASCSTVASRRPRATSVRRGRPSVRAYGIFLGSARRARSRPPSSSRGSRSTTATCRARGLPLGAPGGAPVEAPAGPRARLGRPRARGRRRHPSRRRDGRSSSRTPAAIGASPPGADCHARGLATRVRSARARVVERAQKLEDELSSHVPDESHAAWAERTQRAELIRVAASPRVGVDAHAPRVGAPAARARPGRTERSRGRVEADAASALRRPAWRKATRTSSGGSDALSGVLGVLDKVAGSDAMVLIRGESGTGKELVAEALHRASDRAGTARSSRSTARRSSRRCSSRELFGHEKGAFTGALGAQDAAASSWPTAARSSSTRSATSRRARRSRSSACSRSETFERVGGTTPDPRRRAHRLRDAPRPRGDGRARRVPRGPLLPPARRRRSRCPPLRERLGDLPRHRRAPPRAHRRASAASRRRRSRAAALDAASRATAGRATSASSRTCCARRRSSPTAAVLRPGGPRRLRRDLRRRTRRWPSSRSRRRGGTSQPIESLASSASARGDVAVRAEEVVERECIVRALDETEGNITRAATLLGMKRPRLSQLVKHYGLKAED